MSSLRLVSRARTKRLSDDETVRLGRLLTHSLGVVHVSFPDSTPTAEAVAHNYAEHLPPGVVPLVVDVLGEFDQVVVDAAIGAQLRRFWFTFPRADDHGCLLPQECGVTGWSEDDAIQLVADSYCDRRFKPPPLSIEVDFDVSRLDDNHDIRPNIGVPAWRGIWFPHITRP